MNEKVDEQSSVAKRSRKEKVKLIRCSSLNVASVPKMETIPGVLDPMAFAAARTSEVLLMKKEMETGLSRNALRVFQLLPRSMRRRAASHNMKRLPIRLRERALSQLKKEFMTAPKKIKKPPCRKRRRRPKVIAKEFAQRQLSKRWLETHLWHAKRARMEDLWGYRIAIKSNEKCRKSCIRASRSGCFLYDSSYEEVIVLDGLERLEGMVSPEIFKRIHQVIDSNSIGHHFWSTLLTSPTSDKDVGGVLLGPAKVILTVEATLAQIRLLVHPLLTSSVAKFMASSVILKGEFSIFQVEGQKTFDILRSIVPLPYQSLKELPAQLAIEVAAPDPRFTFPQVVTEPLEGRAEFCHFWDVEANKNNVGRRQPEKNLNDLRSQHVIPGTKLVPCETTDPKMPVLVLGDSCIKPDQRRHHQWTILVPQGWGWSLWRSLVFLGARFGGLMEANLISFENDRPVFPNDFVPALGYKEFSEPQAIAAEAKWSRIPPAKRPNYAKLGVASPFSFDFDLLSCSPRELRICKIESTDRGVPEFNARVRYDGQLIGFVTTGDYSQTFGKGIALASCHLPSETIPIKVTLQNVGGPIRSALITAVIY